MSSTTLPVCPKTGSTSPSLTIHLCLHTALLREIGNAPPAGYVPMQDATRLLGVSRQTVLQRVKCGELDAVHVHLEKRKGLRIKVIDDQATLLGHSS